MFPVTRIHPVAMSFLRLPLPPNCEVAKVGNPSENQLETKHARSFGPLWWMISGIPTVRYWTAQYWRGPCWDGEFRPIRIDFSLNMFWNHWKWRSWDITRGSRCHAHVQSGICTCLAQTHQKRRWKCEVFVRPRTAYVNGEAWNVLRKNGLDSILTHSQPLCCMYIGCGSYMQHSNHWKAIWVHKSVVQLAMSGHSSHRRWCDIGKKVCAASHGREKLETRFMHVDLHENSFAPKHATITSRCPEAAESTYVMGFVLNYAQSMSCPQRLSKLCSPTAHHNLHSLLSSDACKDSGG